MKHELGKWLYEVKILSAENNCTELIFDGNNIEEALNSARRMLDRWDDKFDIIGINKIQTY